MSMMKVKRRKKTPVATASVERTTSLSEFEVVESGIGGDLYNGSKVGKPTKTVTFDLNANIRLEKLKKQLKTDNSVVARAGLVQLDVLSEVTQHQLLKDVAVGRGFRAQEHINNLDPQDKRKLRRFPANRTLGMTPADHLLIAKLSTSLKAEVSSIYRAGLIALEQMGESELRELIGTIPRKKRGAPKRNLA